MRRMARWVLFGAVGLATACGGGGEDGEDAITPPPDTQGETAEVQGTSCTTPGSDGLPCVDNDPCTTGEGYCLLGTCTYEAAQKYSCPPPEDKECYGEGECDGQGGCTYGLADGWCEIEGKCIEEGTENPENECAECVPAENRGGWTPATGGSCTPEGNPCATTGVCQKGFCVPKAEGTDCASDHDCLAQDDGDICNGVYKCEACACVFDETTIVTCESEGDTACAANVCNPDMGVCGMTPKEDGTACDDGDPCTSPDYCEDGECHGGETSAPVWTPTGVLDAAYLTAVRLTSTAPAQLYAVGSGGVFYRSKDLGQTFERSDIVASGGELGDWLFLTSQATPSILALFGKKLIVSNDGGMNFVKKLDGCSALAQGALVQESFVAICNGQLYASSDSGASWTPGMAVPIPGGAKVTALAAKDLQLIFFGTAGEDAQGRGHLYRTQDGGMTFNQADPADRPDVAYVSPRGILLSNTAPDKVFVGYSNPLGVPFPFGSYPLFRSDDGGLTYTSLNPNVQASTYVPLVLNAIGILLMGGDSGINRGGNFGTGPWGHIPEPIPAGSILFHRVTSAALHPVSATAFYVPASNGLALAEELGAKWTLLSKGLSGGRFSHVAACMGGTTLYGFESLGAGLYKSADSGASWKLVSTPPLGEGVGLTSLACSATGDTAIYGHTAAGGQLVSTNGGTMFTAANEQTGAVLGSYNAIASSPQMPETIYVSRLGMGVFRSDDGGILGGGGFVPIALAEAYVSSLLVDPFEPTRLYVGTFPTPGLPKKMARVYLCQDKGNTCSVVVQTDVQESDGMIGYMLAADPSFAGRVFAMLPGSEAGIKYSNDSGNSWNDFVALPRMGMLGRGEILPDREKKGSLWAAFRSHPVVRYDAVTDLWSVPEDGPAALTSIVYASEQGDELLAGSALEAKVLSSADAGVTWSILKDFALPDYQVRKLVSEKGKVFAILSGKGTGDGKLFQKSGNVWQECPVATAVTDVAVLDAAGQQVLAAGKFGGLYRSENGGQSFVPFGALDAGATDLLVHPGEPNMIWAAVGCGKLPVWYDPNESFLGSDCGVKRSMDGGQTWFTVLNTGQACLSLAGSPNDPDVVVAACPGAGTYYTKDLGDNWSELSGNTHLSEGATVVMGGGYLYVGTLGFGILRGEVNPDDWFIKDWKGDFSAPVRKLTPVRTIEMAVLPDNASKVMVYAYPGGLMRTDDFGDRWESADDRLAPEGGAMESGTAAAIIPRYFEGTEGTELWAAVAGRGLFESRDQGEHWAFASYSLPVSKSHPIDIVFHDPAPNSAWLIAKEGVFRTTDAGTGWQKLETGYPKGPAEAALPPRNNNLYVSVGGNGIYRIAYDGANWQKIQAVNYFGTVSAAFGGRKMSLWATGLPDAASDKALLVGVDPHGLYATEDGGASYSPAGLGLPAGAVLGLERSPHDPNFVVAGTAVGPFGSFDGGDTFAPLYPGGASPGLCVSFSFDAVNTETIYALCADKVPHGIAAGDEDAYGLRKLYRTKDKGATWETGLNAIAPTKWPVQVMADPAVEGRVFVVTVIGGILRSDDWGDAFVGWSTGLPAPFTGATGLLHARPLAAAEGGTKLVLGTDGFGFYWRYAEAECE